MDPRRFDEITKSLVTGVSRRQALKVLGGGVIGSIAGLIGHEQTSADSPQRRCKEASRPCSFDTHCCSGTCCNKRCCGPGEICDGNGQCVPACIPDHLAACAGRDCGAVLNNCGETVVCGSCGANEACDTNGQCICIPDNATACSGQNCGSVTNNCGQQVSCGSCTAPETCGGGGTPNVCGGCTPESPGATCAGKCGTVLNNCGEQVDCGGCILPQTCGGGGEVNVCGCLSDPVATTCAGICGTVVDNCDMPIDCTGECAGCCDEDGACVAGTAVTACGASGANCVACPGPTGGTCEGTPICAAGTCDFVPAGPTTVCRPPQSTCDIAETCSGSSLMCPPDRKRDACQQGFPASTCGTNCWCFTLPSGDSFCGGIGLCYDCTSDAECEAEEGPGWVCVNSGNGCCGEGVRACHPPCGG